jgi:alpha-glucosidase
VSWWREAVFYQIYPRSFCDGSGDGIGDLAGLRSQLDYLVDLGVDALWLSPIFPSPMADFGYDVSDYCDVDAVFGSLDEAQRLFDEAHDRGLRVILDWVPNHTSAEHPGSSTRDVRERVPDVTGISGADSHDDGSLPNNWLSSWNGQPDWTYDEASEQYYLHCFLTRTARSQLGQR